MGAGRGVDGCKKAPGGCLAALGRGLGTWRGDNDPDVEIRARAAPCGNLPVFNVGERTGGGQVLPNGNIALPAPVKKFLNRDQVNLFQLFRCNSFCTCTSVVPHHFCIYSSPPMNVIDRHS